MKTFIETVQFIFGVDAGIIFIDLIVFQGPVARMLYNLAKLEMYLTGRAAGPKETFAPSFRNPDKGVFERVPFENSKKINVWPMKR